MNKIITSKVLLYSSAVLSKAKANAIKIADFLMSSDPIIKLNPGRKLYLKSSKILQKKKKFYIKFACRLTRQIVSLLRNIQNVIRTDSPSTRYAIIITNTPARISRRETSRKRVQIKRDFEIIVTSTFRFRHVGT